MGPKNHFGADRAHLFGISLTCMDSELVILRVCQDINEAYLFQSVLAGSGVEAFIPDEYAVSYPPIAIFAGGVQLLVRNEDIERAVEILASTEPEEPSV